ncbi:MAG: sigma-70 family RNA polymerase sigma factor, partial [Planctomycetota bacterium]|nr:sigma-70 family RNA polymerase sigma factor [Planctomycetota bacterium]
AELEPVLRALADRDRVVLELRFTQDLTHAQVAAVLGVSERTAKSWAARALEHLRERLEEQR